MKVRTGMTQSVDDQFVMDRFGYLLRRRLQVAAALKQMPAAAGSQMWLIRALDGAIVDEVLQLDRIGLQSEVRACLRDFRETLGTMSAGDAIGATLRERSGVSH